MRAYQLFSLVILVHLLVLASTASAQFRDFDDKDVIAAERADLLEVVRVMNLPPEAQLRELPHVYKEIWRTHPAVAGAVGVDVDLARIDRKVTSLSPEAFAEVVEAHSGYAVPNAVYDLCVQLLGPHAVDLAP
jgi:hypothetical protein